MMILDLVVIVAVLLFGIVIGFVIGVDQVRKRASDGICIRADDGEVYLKLSEVGQAKLADPSTRILYLLVTNVSTRNNQPL